MLSDPEAPLTRRAQADSDKEESVNEELKVEEVRRSKREHKEKEDTSNLPVDFTNKVALLKPFPQQEYETLAEAYTKATGRAPTGSTYHRLWEEAFKRRALAYDSSITIGEFQANLCLEFSENFDFLIFLANVAAKDTKEETSEPRFEWEVNNHPFAKEFHEAEQKEKEALIAADVYTVITSQKIKYQKEQKFCLMSQPTK
jgi:hypothetical protein